MSNNYLIWIQSCIILGIILHLSNDFGIQLRQNEDVFLPRFLLLSRTLIVFFFLSNDH